MAEGEQKTSNAFDLRTIKELVGLMSRNDLCEIDLRDGSVRIRLRRGAKEAVPAVPAPAAATPPPVAPAPAPAAPAKPEAPATPTKKLDSIKSPTPGTFYGSPTPDSEPFVHVGSKVTPTTVVCLIEAMKIFNEITADVSGVVTEILVENQQPVEYGQGLFTVDPAG